MPDFFTMSVRYTVQSIHVTDDNAFQKLAAHLGLAVIIPRGWLEFEVTKKQLEDWVYMQAVKRDNLAWFNREFFEAILELNVDRYNFQCPPIILLDDIDLPGEVLF